MNLLIPQREKYFVLQIFTLNNLVYIKKINSDKFDEADKTNELDF